MSSSATSPALISSATSPALTSSAPPHDEAEPRHHRPPQRVGDRRLVKLAAEGLEQRLKRPCTPIRDRTQIDRQAARLEPPPDSAGHFGRGERSLERVRGNEHGGRDSGQHGWQYSGPWPPTT
jgi:hypothetical protein